MATFGMPNFIYGQEGELGQEKEESSEVILKDSIPVNGEFSIIEGKDQSDVLPVGPMPQFNISKLPAVEISSDKEEKPQINSGEKIKTEESQSKHSFNFIYYLFYKFKLVDATDG